MNLWMFFVIEVVGISSWFNGGIGYSGGKLFELFKDKGSRSDQKWSKYDFSDPHSGFKLRIRWIRYKNSILN